MTPASHTELGADILEIFCLVMSLDDLASLETERIGREMLTALCQVRDGRVRASA